MQTQVSSTAVKFIWDGQNVVMETDGQGNTQGTHTQTPNLYRDLGSQCHSATTKYYHFDALGTDAQCGVQGSMRQPMDNADRVGQTQRFRRSVWRPYGGLMWLISFALGTMLAVTALDRYLDLGINMNAMSDEELGAVMMALSCVLCVSWIAFLFGITRRYHELRIVPEGLCVLYPVRKRQVIPWHEMHELQDYLPNAAIWTLRTTHQDLTITHEVEDCLGLVAELGKRVRVVRPAFAARDARCVPEIPPWHGLIDRTYDSQQEHLGWLLPGGCLGTVAFVWFAAIFSIIRGQLDGVFLVVFAVGWSGLAGALGWGGVGWGG